MKLYYFTASYPYGLGEEWKAHELRELVHVFEEITVIPFSYAGNFDAPKILPAGVRLKGPLFRTEGKPLRASDLLKILFHRKVFVFMQEFFRKRVYRKKTHFTSWVAATLNSIRLLRHPVIRSIITGAKEEARTGAAKKTILYFYWGKGGCEFLPFIDTNLFFKVFVRMHRYDLFEHVNDGYIPYRERLLKKITVAAPSSKAGFDHLRALYPRYADKVQLFRLGTLWNGKRVASSQDGVFRVVSCSFLAPVKRVNLMVESLRYIDFPIEWRHVGDGAQRKDIDALIAKYGLEKKFIIEGIIDARHLQDYYASRRFDLFVNVSASEGIPMSIMEALFLGIPVMATGVGGNGEIVDDQGGRLLPSDPDPRQIADALQAYYRLPPEEKERIRDNAHEKCVRDWDLQKLTRELILSLQKN